MGNTNSMQVVPTTNTKVEKKRKKGKKKGARNLGNFWIPRNFTEPAISLFMKRFEQTFFVLFILMRYMSIKCQNCILG